VKTFTNAAVPPESTFTVPAETFVPESATPLATPPEEMFSVPPLEIVTLLVVMPAMSSVPPLDGGFENAAHDNPSLLVSNQ
jgi:hypothetical protein